MAGYIARSYPAKKLETLQRRESELAAKVRNGLNGEELVRFAEKVREARLAYLKGKRYFLLEPRPAAPIPRAEERERRRDRDYVVKFVSDGLDKVDAEITEWLTKPTDEIIATCSKSP